MKILGILACYNRKEKTKSCIETLVQKNPECMITFVVVDDSSTDGTSKMLEELSNSGKYDIHLLKGTGRLFYSGSMHVGMKYALEKFQANFDYCMLLNDDVLFFKGCVKKMVAQSQSQNNAVIVGAMSDATGSLSYSAVKYIKGIRYKKMEIGQWNSRADTFNANCVLIPYVIFRNMGPIDSYFVHSLGDFDYGLELTRYGYKIYVSKEYVGQCENNSNKNTWMDCSLSRRERLRRKESPKGAPVKQWFYFLRKHWGILVAIKGSITPFIRIFFNR